MPGTAESVLAPHRGNGILKKRKVKQLTRGQRARQAQILERAQVVQDQHVSKVDEAKQRAKKVQARRALWEDINEATEEDVRKTIKAPGRFDALQDDALEDDIVPFEGDTEIKVLDGVQVPAFAAGTKMTLGLGGLTQGKPRPKPAEEIVSVASAEGEVS